MVRECIRGGIAGVHIEEQLYPDFVVIARTDACRALGLDEACMRINRAADVGADLGLLFPRNPAEAERAPQVCRLPLVYVQSRGNRDGRPLFSRQDLQQMGYVACIEAQVVLCTAFHFLKQALIEDLIDLSKHYEIEAQTVERRS